MLKRPSTWSSIWRCWAVTQTRELTSGVRARRSMTGAIFTASGRVPRIESTRSGGSGIGLPGAQDMKTETRLAPGRAIPHAAAIDGDSPGHGGSDGSRAQPAEGLMVDEEGDRLGLLQGGLEVGSRGAARGLRRRRKGVEGGDEGAGAGQRRRHLDGGALAQVVHVGLVGEAEGGDAAPLQAPQGALDQAGGVRRLVVVHLTRLADQAGEIWRGLDEEPGIDADAVAAHAGPRAQNSHPGVAIGKVDGLPDVDAEAFGEAGELVGQGDVYISECVLHELDHLGR